MSGTENQEVDKNFIIETKINKPDIVFYNPKSEPFRIYGLYDYKNESVYKRLPDEIGTTTNPGVKKLYLMTAGGRLRFSTNSKYVAIKVKMPYIGHKPHMPLTGTTGFDLYIDTDADSCFYNTYKPPIHSTDGYESVIEFSDCKYRSITINFPSYNAVDELLIGLSKDAKVGEGRKYRNKSPVVFYGSSITQGACSSRPGLTYENIISRRLNLDYINLGFSGNGLAEENIVRYMSGLDMCMFVSDYDHNAPSVEYLEETHCRMYKIIREANPDIPYIMLSRPDFDRNYKDSIRRRNVIIDTYRYALKQGDENVYYIDGEGIFQGNDEDCCTVDTTHPNDLGFKKMADSIGRVMVRAMR